ncbi:MAG: hypothetical protein R3B47_15395 [Bacteroidia bacterium]
MRFPYVEFVDKAARQRTGHWMALFVILMILPSCWLLYTVLRDQRNQINMDRFVEKQITDGDHFVMPVPGR